MLVRWHIYIETVPRSIKPFAHLPQSTSPITVGQRKKVTAVTFFPARPQLDQAAQIRAKYTKFQLTANTGIPVCLVREIWQFKVFTGKEVTPLHEEGNSLKFRAGKKVTHSRYKWFIDIWQTDKTERKERSQCEIVNWKYVSRCDEQMKNTCLMGLRPRGDVRNTIGTEWRRLKHI